MPEKRITQAVLLVAEAAQPKLRITQLVSLFADAERATLRETQSVLLVADTVTTTTIPPEAQVQKALGYAVLSVPDGAVVRKGLGYAVLEATTTTTTSTTTSTTAPPEWIVEDVVITFATTTTTTTAYPGCWADEPFNNLNEWSVAGDGIWGVASGKFFMSTSSGGDITATSAWQCVSGVFDVEIDFNLTTAPASDDWAFAFRYYIDSNHYAEIDASLRTASHNKYFYTTYQNGGGAIENSASRTYDYGKLRIRREATGSVKLYYQDGVGSWTLLTTITNINSTDAGVIQLLGTSWDNDPTATVEWDNFTVTEGCSNFQYPPTTTTTTSSSTTHTTTTVTGPPPSTTTTTTSTTTTSTAPFYTGMAYGTEDRVPRLLPTVIDWVTLNGWHEWRRDDYEGDGRTPRIIGGTYGAVSIWQGEAIRTETVRIEDYGSTKYFMPMVNRYEYTTSCTPTNDLMAWYRVAYDGGDYEEYYGTWQPITFGEIYNTTADYVQFRLRVGTYSTTTTTTSTSTTTV